MAGAETGEDAPPPVPLDARGRRAARHDLLVVQPDGWAEVAASRAPAPPLPPEALALVERWGRAGWPVIARRPAPGDPAGAVPAGLPLPPRFGKARVALAIPPGAAWRITLPVTLARAARAAPEAWRGTIDDVLRLARSLSLVPRVFGALLWEAVTGMAYLGPASDLDLLWPVEEAEAVGPLLAGLEEIAARAPVRLDGELLTAVGGVQWRELAEARRRGTGIVLAKSLARAGFVEIGAVPGAASLTSAAESIGPPSRRRP